MCPQNFPGAITAEYAYLNGQPLVKTEGADVYYYHNDHLGTPQMMTDGTGAIVWSADYKPFGEATITISTITNNLRFPGQYQDHETGLHQNYFRDYNPNNGTYIEADPIGIKGGLNLFVYAKNNTLRYTDIFGLKAMGRYTPCEKLPFIQRCICKKGVDESCKTAPEYCCEWDLNGCMLDIPDGDSAYEWKASQCYGAYQDCMFRAGKQPKPRGDLLPPPGTDRYPAPPGRGNPNRNYPE